MQRIANQREGFSSLAKKVLGWLTYAERLMSITEVQYAIAVELGEKRFDEDNLDDANELVSVCAGLVVVDDESNIIRLVHYTTQEYFEQNGENVLPGARQAIAESCFTYLLYDDFATGWLYKNHNDSHNDDNTRNIADISSILRSDKFEIPGLVRAMLRHHPFCEYAVEHWATHAKHNVQDNAKSLFLEFARDDHKISSAAQLLFWLNYDTTATSQLGQDESRSSKPISAMHVLSYLGAEELISVLLEDGFEADAKDVNNSTPLWWAAYKGKEKVAKLLLSRQSVDVNHHNLEMKRTALLEAADEGHVEIVKLLIAREDVDVNLCDRTRRTPLSGAAEEGHSAIVELLLSRKDVEADIKCCDDKTPLLYAAQSGHENIMRHLLKRKDIDINAIDKDGNTTLMLAIWRQKTDIVRMLLARVDLDMEQKYRHGMTPLRLAVVLGFQAEVELLLSRDDVGVNARRHSDDTPLLYAAIAGRKAIAELLLSRDDVEVNVKHRFFGDTPLIYAARCGHKAIVELLLSHDGIDVNVKDISGSTALHRAAAQGHEDIVKLLLAHPGIDLDIEDGKGRNIVAQVEDQAPIFAEEESSQEPEEREKLRKGQQAALKLVRAGFEECCSADRKSLK